MQSLFGIETEYAITGIGDSGRPVERLSLLITLLEQIRARWPTLPDRSGHGLFLPSGARVYLDAGEHIELTTPECSDPGEIVRYIQAGEWILADLAPRLCELLGLRDLIVQRCNVDYAGQTWGTHESFLHRTSPGSLAEHLVPHLVSRLSYTGAGGFRDDSRHAVRFTLSPRVFHLEHEISAQSTRDRAIYHTKDEPHAADSYHRLHLICGESNCSETAVWLKIATTALVVAMAEAGLRPGAGVRLQAPLVAMRTFAGDPWCRATAPAADGQKLSAVAIQRHYLELAERHADAAFMPPWAPLACRRWREILDRLEAGPEAVVGAVDWATKLAVLRPRVNRSGLDRHLLRRLNRTSAEIDGASMRLDAGADPVPEADEPESPEPKCAVRRRPTREEFAAFARLRAELLELDLRFGELGPRGIFTALDAGGVIAHRLLPPSEPGTAVEKPPALGRARLRGRMVRQLAGQGQRYVCDWGALYDRQARRVFDLSVPFAEAAEWAPWAERGLGAGG